MYIEIEKNCNKEYEICVEDEGTDLTVVAFDEETGDTWDLITVDINGRINVCKECIQDAGFELNIS